MTRNEKKILKTAINTVTHHNKNIWWELKREIFDHGFQPHYYWQSEFENIAHRVINKLSDADKQLLFAEWKNAKPPRTVKSDEEILNAYTQLIIEEVVSRASVAANRTENW
ncbi:conserved hypothetical protein [Candidatus Methylobacter favarea]|uniref:Uncharacterized protein n=1 Tax=Candidatus Methylobacter favarea TaxID=2707345 RepID=A0A8S0XTU3_9GAMM|nr:hypothetical protein [Candidatus Methylobacter favarea]CAA9891998.1 conserved hypothetical protein [Candidatus Methylobacter favarea]